MFDDLTSSEDDGNAIHRNLKECKLIAEENELAQTKLFEETGELPKIDPDLSIFDQIVNYPPIGWGSVFIKGLNRVDIVDRNLSSKELRKYYPYNPELFTAYRFCNLSNVKVIIFGQDPYMKLNKDGSTEAVGMSFSARKGAKIPPSLANIIKELNREYPDLEKNTDGWLGNWATQGVLLLNTFLTYHQRKLQPHEQKIWKPIINLTIKRVVEVNPDVIVMLWGAVAQKELDGKFGNRATILTCGHPSPQNRNSTFNGCGHFRRANEILIEQGKEPIDWTIKH